MTDAALQYPIGKFEWSGVNTPEDRRRCIEEIERTPGAFARGCGRSGFQTARYTVSRRWLDGAASGASCAR